MSAGLRRRIADLACRSLCGLLPSHLRSWGEAVRADVAQIPDDGEALGYALSSLGGLSLWTLARHVVGPVIGDPSKQSFSGESSTVTDRIDRDFHPRMLFLICGTAAVLLGILNLWMTGAPMQYLAINFVALLVGYVLLAILDRVHSPAIGGDTAIIWLAAAALLVTAMFGQPVEGASRWFRIAGLSVQPTLILLPLMMLCFGRAGTWVGAAGIAVGALAIALQPDRGMAGVLSAGVIAIALLRRDARSWAAALTGVASLIATLAQPDRLPAVPYVDQLLTTVFDVHPVAGLAVLTGSVLLVLPAAIAWVTNPGERVLYGALGSAWLAAIAAAALGNYPTPLLGYGGSAIIGYVLALGALRKSTAHRHIADTAHEGALVPKRGGACSEPLWRLDAQSVPAGSTRLHRVPS